MDFSFLVVDPVMLIYFLSFVSCALVILVVLEFIFMLPDLDFLFCLWSAIFSQYKVMMEIFTKRGTKVYRVPEKISNILAVDPYGGFIESDKRAINLFGGVKMYSQYEGNAIPFSALVLSDASKIKNVKELIAYKDSLKFRDEKSYREYILRNLELIKASKGDKK